MTEQADLDVRTSQPTATAGLPAPPTGANWLPLSLTQILGSVLAAISATVVASYFGVAGTVIGAALGSLVSVVGGAVYTHSMNRTRDRIRTRAVESAVLQRFGVAVGNAGLGTARDQPDETHGGFGARLRAGVGGIGGRRLLMSAAALFIVVLGAVTAFELVSGQPLSATVSASHGSGISLGGGHRSAVQLPAAPASRASSSSRKPDAPSAGGRSGVKVTTNPAATTDPTAGTSASNSSSAVDRSASPGGSTGSAGSSAPASPAPTSSGTGAVR